MKSSLLVLSTIFGVLLLFLGERHVFGHAGGIARHDAVVNETLNRSLNAAENVSLDLPSGDFSNGIINQTGTGEVVETDEENVTASTYHSLTKGGTGKDFGDQSVSFCLVFGRTLVTKDTSF